MQYNFEEISIIIKEKRRLGKFTQSDIARILNITQGRYSRLERNPEQMTLKQLLIVLGQLEGFFLIFEDSMGKKLHFPKQK